MHSDVLDMCLFHLTNSHPQSLTTGLTNGFADGADAADTVEVAHLCLVGILHLSPDWLQDERFADKVHCQWEHIFAWMRYFYDTSWTLGEDARLNLLCLLSGLLNTSLFATAHQTNQHATSNPTVQLLVVLWLDQVFDSEHCDHAASRALTACVLLGKRDVVQKIEEIAGGRERLVQCALSQVQDATKMSNPDRSDCVASCLDTLQTLSLYSNPDPDADLALYRPIILRERGIAVITEALIILTTRSSQYDLCNREIKKDMFKFLVVILGNTEGARYIVQALQHGILNAILNASLHKAGPEDDEIVELGADLFEIISDAFMYHSVVRSAVRAVRDLSTAATQRGLNGPGLRAQWGIFRTRMMERGTLGKLLDRELMQTGNLLRCSNVCPHPLKRNRD